MLRITILVLFLSFSAQAGEYTPEKFATWKKSYIKRWGKREVPRSYIKKHLEAANYLERVVEIDRNQVTRSKEINYSEWIQTWLNSEPNRIERGKELLKKHKELLQKVEDKYGVDKEAIVALWGVETLYGTMTGTHKVIESTATLAFDGRRRRFFEKELFTALKILHQGHVEPENFKGSWSGAMGQCQFMPSSFMRRAVDFDGDGKKDIWNSLPDTFGSIARYLKLAKWQKGKSIGELAFQKSPKNFNVKRYRTAAQYNKLGLRDANGNKFSGNWKRRAAKIPHQNSPYVLRGSNYMSVIRWNNSSLFAAFNILLMDAFKGTD